MQGETESLLRVPVAEFDPFLALTFGVFVGFLVQTVASRLRYNGEWPKIPMSRKLAMSATGAIAAFVVGLYRLDNPDPSPAPDTSYVYSLWLWQTIAAWAGAVFLDVLAKLLVTWTEKNGKR